MGDFDDLMRGADMVSSSIMGLSSQIAAEKAAKSMQESAQQWQEDEWTRQFYLQNERQDYLLDYQSPAQYVQRLRQAGLNPAALLQSGQNILGQLSAPGVSSPGQVSSPHYSPVEMGFAQSFEHIGNFAKALADARKAGVDTQLLQDTFDDQIRLMRQRVTSAELENVNQRLDNYVKDKIKDIKVKQAYKDYDYTCTMEANARFTGSNIQADTSLKKAQILLDLARERLTTEQYQELSIIVRNKQAIIDSEINRNVAAATESRAAASAHVAAAGMYTSQTEYNYALADTENKMRDGRLTMQELQNESQRIANTVANSNMRTFVATESDRLKALISEYERAGFITEKARADMQKAVVDANFAEVEKYMNAVSQALGSVTGVYNAGSQRISSLSAVQRNEVQREFNRILDTHWSPNEPKPIRGFGYNVNP